MVTALQTNHTVQWIPVPGGLQPDAYISHLRNIELPEDRTNSTRGRIAPGSGIVLESSGSYKGRPIHLLGDTEQTHLEWNPNSTAAKGELSTGLRILAGQLTDLRIRYLLGWHAWTHRDIWQSSQLHIVHQGERIAVIDCSRWRVAVKVDATVLQIGHGEVQRHPTGAASYTQGDYEIFPMELALWTYARRSIRQLLRTILPPSLEKLQLQPGRPLPVPIAEIGKECLAMMKYIERDSISVLKLRKELSKLTDEEFMRALACLIASDAARTEPVESLISKFSGLFSRKPVEE